MNPMTLKILQGLHNELRNDGSESAKRVAHEIIDLFQLYEGLTGEEARIWHLAIKACPGHDDEGGRDWCSYCGVMSDDVDSEQK